MDNAPIFLAVLKHYGLSGLIIAWIVWDKYVYPTIRKSKGTFVSYKTLEDRMSKMEATEAAHEKENIRQFAVIETVRAVQIEKNAHFIETLERLEKGQEKTFNLISELKSLLIKS